MIDQLQDPLQDIRHYSPTMTIAQVLKFCERNNIQITRGMVQNYIRDGLLPPPVSKRYYTHRHIATLAMISRLKTVFDMPTIREVLQPYMDIEGISVDTYATIMEKMTGLILKWQTGIAPALTVEGDGGLLLSMLFATQLKGTVTRQ